MTSEFRVIISFLYQKNLYVHCHYTHDFTSDENPMSRALLLREVHLQEPSHNMKPNIKRFSDFLKRERTSAFSIWRKGEGISFSIP